MQLLARLLHDITLQVQQLGLYPQWDAMLARLMLPMPGRFLTEAEGDDVISVSKVIAAILCMTQARAAHGFLPEINSGIYKCFFFYFTNIFHVVVILSYFKP